jgi:hypothetical protein
MVQILNGTNKLGIKGGGVAELVAGPPTKL